MTDPPGMEAIERASRDEIAALQTQRLAWSLRHTYENVPHYKHAFDAAGFEETSRERLFSEAGVPLSFVTYTRRVAAGHTTEP